MKFLNILQIKVKRNVFMHQNLTLEPDSNTISNKVEAFGYEAEDRITSQTRRFEWQFLGYQQKVVHETVL